LTVDASAIPADELIISKDIISQEFYLGDLFYPHRILVVNLNLLTIFCIFYQGKYIFENLIFKNS
jgi:hypothetical protein